MLEVKLPYISKMSEVKKEGRGVRYLCWVGNGPPRKLNLRFLLGLVWLSEVGGEALLFLEFGALS